MASVSGRTAMGYGAQLFGWLLLVGAAGGVVSSIGFVLAGGGTGVAGTIVGGLLFLAGGLLVTAGVLGLLFKVIVDAIQAAEESSPVSG